MVGVDDGRVAQSLHQSEQWRVPTRVVLARDLQLDDDQTSLVRCAKEIDLAETGVRVRSLQRKLVVEQTQPASTGPRPLGLEVPERNRQMLLRRTAGILRPRASIVSDEVALVAGGSARRHLPQLAVLRAQGIDVDSRDRICQTRRVGGTLGEQDWEVSSRETAHCTSLVRSRSVAADFCTNLVSARA